MADEQTRKRLEALAGALFAGLLGIEALGPRLIAALTDVYFLTRMEAATALGKLRWMPAVPELRLSLRDEDILTRLAAIEALTPIPDPELKTAYTGCFVDDSPEYRFGVLDDADPRVRADAIRVLRHHRPSCAREVLLDYITRLEEHEAEAEEGEITVKDREVEALARQVLAELGHEIGRRHTPTGPCSRSLPSARSSASSSGSV